MATAPKRKYNVEVYPDTLTPYCNIRHCEGRVMVDEGFMYVKNASGQNLRVDAFRRHCLLHNLTTGVTYANDEDFWQDYHSDEEYYGPINKAKSYWDRNKIQDFKGTRVVVLDQGGRQGISVFARPPEEVLPELGSM
jgi:hypothetical protein